MQYIAERAMVPLAGPQTPGAFYRGLRVVTLEGSTLEVADEAANRKVFGVPGTQQGRTGYSQLRFVGLAGEWARMRSSVWPWAVRRTQRWRSRSEIPQARMLCLADQGLAGYPLWQAAMQTGAHLLWRIPKNRILPVLQRFEDGSYLSEIEPAPRTRQKMMADAKAMPLTVRVIDYPLPGVENAEPV